MLHIHHVCASIRTHTFCFKWANANVKNVRNVEREELNKQMAEIQFHLNILKNDWAKFLFLDNFVSASSVRKVIELCHVNDFSLTKTWRISEWLRVRDLCRLSSIDERGNNIVNDIASKTQIEWTHLRMCNLQFRVKLSSTCLHPSIGHIFLWCVRCWLREMTLHFSPSVKQKTE